MAASTRPPRAARFQRIPPPPDTRPELEVLHELEGGHDASGLALWEALRDTTLWARAAEESRGGLFHPRPSGAREHAAEAVAAGIPELSEAWARLDAVSRAPAAVDRDALAEACGAVYAWAEERALMQTAAHFAEAAALVKPDAAHLANLAARTCRRAGLPGRAGPWYQRGRALAIRAHSFPDRFSATVGYGWLMYSLGRYDRARRIISSTVRQAVNRGYKRMAGEAEHNLLAICSEMKLFSLGEGHARRALYHYPTHHPLVPFLVHDVAYLLVVCAIYTPALSILQQAINAMPRPQDPVLAWATAARAAAGAGQREMYAHARDTAIDLANRYPELAPSALRGVAYAAQLAEDWELAEDTAQIAARLARERRMADVERTALVLLEEVKLRQPGVSEVAPPANSHVEEISRACKLKIRLWQGPKRGRPPGQTPPA
ncbi:MAG TPA: hypothetical protein VHG91_05760 [Longimicrobium sp.]|nr:hypothetical protein [Longimicrobium sp.]